MSNYVQGLVWKIDFPNPLAKIIALKLADNASDDGERIYPSNATICRMTGCSRGVVLKWLAAMEHPGLLRVVARSVGGNNTDTTERAYDMDLLHRLARKDRRTPPELDLRVGQVDRPLQSARDGQARLDIAPKLVRITVLEIVPHGAPVLVVDGSKRRPVHQKDGSPVHQKDGSKPRPVLVVNGTRPPEGPDSINQPLKRGTSPTSNFAEGAGDGLIPFDNVTDRAPEGAHLQLHLAHLTTVGGGVDPKCATSVAILKLGEANVAKKRMATDKDRLPFSRAVIRTISSKLFVNPEKLIARYHEKTKGQDIDSPNAYLLRMAQQEAADRDGTTVSEIVQLTTKHTTKRENIAASPLNAEAQREKNRGLKGSPELRASLDRLGRMRGTG